MLGEPVHIVCVRNEWHTAIYIYIYIYSYIHLWNIALAAHSPQRSLSHHSQTQERNADSRKNSTAEGGLSTQLGATAEAALADKAADAVGAAEAPDLWSRLESVEATFGESIKAAHFPDIGSRRLVSTELGITPRIVQDARHEWECLSQFNTVLFRFVTLNARQLYMHVYTHVYTHVHTHIHAPRQDARSQSLYVV